jgi:hypothetical protein
VRTANTVCADVRDGGSERGGGQAASADGLYLHGRGHPSARTGCILADAFIRPRGQAASKQTSTHVRADSANLSVR